VVSAVAAVVSNSVVVSKLVVSAGQLRCLNK
jgi:hypothetical protein